MPELTSIPAARLSELRAALTRLARDQALRTRVALLVDRLAELPGHERTVVELLRLVTDDLGVENAAVFYRIGDGLYRLDVLGRNRVAGEAEDGLVRHVLETRESVFSGPVHGPTGATTEVPGVVTRVMPLLVGAELVGVLRFEELSVAGRDLREDVQPLLPFLGVALENAVSGEKSGRRASDEANRPDRGRGEDGSGPRRREAKLEQAKDELERRVAERRAELSRVLEGTSSPAFSLDREYRYVAFNRSHALAMKSLYGVEIEIGRSILDDMTVARDRETARRNLDRALAGEQLLEPASFGEEPGSRKYYDVSHHPILAIDGSVIGVAVFASDVTERRRAEEDRLAHLRFFESLDLINRALQGTSDLEQMMSDVLDAVLTVFGCDRAWLVYPCDPSSATYRVPMERTRPEYPGALARGLEVPVDPETARVLEAVKASSRPVTFGPGLQQPLPTVLSERFRVQSQIAVAVYPKVSLPWVFGLHQCSFRRVWTPDDGKLLQEIGRRLGDALTSLRTYRDLEGSEKRYRTLIQRIQAAVVVHGADGRVVASNRKAQELLGLSEDQLLGKAVTDRDWQFFRTDGSVVPPEEFPAHRVCLTRQPLKDLVARIHRSGKNGATDVWVLVNADPVLGRDGEVSQVIVTFSDITELKRAEGRVLREAERGSLLLDLFLRSPELSESQVYDGVLELAVRLTGSALGFLHRVSEDQKTVNLTTWSEAALGSCPAVFDSHDPIEKVGHWVDCVRLGHPVIYNDYAASPDEKGLPPGHAPLRRLMSVPVVEGGAVRIIFGVGNKDAEYDEDDVFQIQQIAGELQKLLRQRHAVERVEFLGRLYRTVSEMNQVIVREKSRDRLFAEVCRIGVEHGGFAMVWAGQVDRAGGAVRPAGAAGLETSYVDELELRLDAPPAELRPAARAVVGNLAVIVDDTGTDPGFALWREAAQKRGFRSCAAFPVRADGSVLGVLAVYAGDAGVFRGEVVALLGELAADLGFALGSIEAEERRTRAEQALRAERGLFVGGPTVVFNWRAREGWPVEYVSPNVADQFGYTQEDFTSGRVLYAGIVHPDDVGRVGAEVSDFSERGVPSFEQVYRIAHADGSYRWIQDFTTVQRDRDGAVASYHGYVLDITDRVQADRELVRVNRALRMLSDSNQALIHETDEAKLLNEVCRIAVEVGGYRLAWVGFAEHDPTRTLRPVARAGLDSEYVELANVSWADDERGRGPGGTAIRTERACVVRSISTDPGFAPWREAATQRGFKSIVALPLVSEGHTLGALGIYAAEEDAFDSRELEILTELAGDLAFGITAMRTRAKRNQVEEALAAQHSTLRGIIEGSTSPIFALGRDYRFVAFNQSHVETMRALYGAEIEVGHSMLEYMTTPGDREKAKETFDRALAGEHVVELVCPETGSRPRRYLEISHHPVLASDGSVAGVAVFATDVTERQRAEDALRESEERYRLIAENTADTITVLDLDLRHVYVSPSVLKLRGFTVEEAMAHSLEQIFTPASLQDVHRLFAEQMALEEGGKADLTRAASLELEEYCKDGSTIWVEIVVSFLRDASLRPTGILAVTRDVTRRKRADLRLVESEQKYRSLADSSPDNIIRYDAEARRVYVNRRTDVSVGLGLGSRLGLTPSEGMPYPGARAYEDRLRRVIQSGEPDEVEVSVPNPAGETRIHSIRFVAERSNDGRIIGALAFGRDVTEQKEAAREKQRYLVQLRQNLEDAVAAIAATVEARDPYTAGHQRRVAALAAAMARELGLAEEDVRGIHLAGTIHDLGKIKVPAEILARPGQLSDIEARLIQIHPEAGWEILKGVVFPWPIAETVLEHHERLDGSGYPRGLKGEQISQGARIIAVADVVEAMASHRPYRASRGLDTALAQIDGDRETLYDATVVDACLRLFREKGYRLAD